MYTVTKRGIKNTNITVKNRDGSEGNSELNPRALQQAVTGNVRDGTARTNSPRAVFRNTGAPNG